MSTSEHPCVLVHQNLFRKSDVPARSRLYRLEPEAMGSLWQESFTSYLNRLGWTHHVSPPAMVVQEILPRLEKTQEVSRQWIGALSRGSAMNINGVGSLALEWSTVLNQLTQRSDLHLLTLRGWVGDLSSVGHLRTCPAWCPICYTEWQEKGLSIYQPLLWLFKVVTICSKHRCLLESDCPHCQKKQSVIALKTHSGHCTPCDRWLGRSLDEKPLPQTTEEFILWQQWVIQVLEELRVASGTEPLQWEDFFTHLAQGMTHAAVTWEQVECFTGVKKHVLLPWFALSKTPSLETILKLCYVCDVTPLEVMKGEITSLVEVLQHEKPSRLPLHRRSRPAVDLDRCRELIQAVLDGREKPMSQNQLCKVLGCSRHKLQHVFPKELALLIQKAREYRKQLDRQRVAKTREQVRQAVFSLHAQGIYPSLHKVQSFLPAGVMLQAEARETWHAVLRELVPFVRMVGRNERKVWPLPLRRAERSLEAGSSLFKPG
jgi:TniQ